jgi:hypothetical protein
MFGGGRSSAAAAPEGYGAIPGTPMTTNPAFDGADQLDSFVAFFKRLGMRAEADHYRLVGGRVAARVLRVCVLRVWWVRAWCCVSVACVSLLGIPHHSPPESDTHTTHSRGCQMCARVACMCVGVGERDGSTCVGRQGMGWKMTNKRLWGMTRDDAIFSKNAKRYGYKYWTYWL